MDKTMMESKLGPVTPGSQRRKFFSQLFAAVGGGLIGGSLLKKLFSSGSEVHQADKTINVTVHPLAVPRTKEGSKSHA